MVQNKYFRILLRPVSIIYAWIYKFRRFGFNYGIFKKEYFKVPIFSVGNVTFGGTGKTPMVIWLIKEIEKMNKVPLVLTRGYKSELEHSSGIVRANDPFQSNSKLLGDEPLMIAKSMNKGAIVIGRSRSENLKKYFSQVNSDIVLLDDGFQHLKIHRSFNLVLFDANMAIKNYQTAPLGYLREGLSSLKFADAIAFSRADQVSEESLKEKIEFLRPYLKEGTLISKFYYKASGVFNLLDEKLSELEDLSGKRVISLTALASPESFNKSLELSGAELVNSHVFKDHHCFTLDDLAPIIEEAKTEDAIIITTKKDIVKLKNITQEKSIHYLDVDVDFISGKKALLSKLHHMLELDSL